MMHTKSIFGVRVAMTLLFGILIGVFFAVARKIFNNETAVFSTILLLSSSTFLYFSTEFRSYTFTMIFSTLQVYYFWKLLNKKTNNIDKYLFIALTFIMVGSHFLTGLVFATEIIFFLIARKSFKMDIHKKIFDVIIHNIINK